MLRPRSSALAALATAVVLTLAGCGGSSATTEAPPDATTEAAAASPVTLLDPAEAQELIDAGGVEVLDVRTPEEYAEGHVEGATLIDFYAPDFEQRIHALDPDTTYLVYCRSGNRSGQATAMMADRGFAAVNDVDGGVVAWQAAGLPLVGGTTP